MTKLNQFERTSCDCHQCQAACKHMPGMLAPGDIDRIAEYVGVDMADEKPADSFIRNNFRASDGAVVVSDGIPFQIPTVVPAQRENGRCVFLTEDDRCSIHPVAPFGCSQFNVCDGPSRDAGRRSSACLQEIVVSIDYHMLWNWLKRKGLTVPSVFNRRQKLQKSLDE